MMEATLAAIGVVLSAVLALLGVLIGHLWKRIRDLEADSRRLVSDLDDAKRDLHNEIVSAWSTRQRMDNHINQLEYHIWQEKPPPPPPRPDGI